MKKKSPIYFQINEAKGEIWELFNMALLKQADLLKGHLFLSKIFL
jgi:hypothetical protein